MHLIGPLGKTRLCCVPVCAQVWTAANAAIEQGAELQAVTERANTAQAAAQAAQAAAADAQAVAARTSSDLAERSAAGVKLFKQVRE